MEIDTRLQSLFSLFFRVPNNGTLPTVSLQRSPIERCFTCRAPSSYLSKSPVDELNPGCPAEPQLREMPVSRVFLS